MLLSYYIAAMTSKEKERAHRMALCFLLLFLLCPSIFTSLTSASPSLNRQEVITSSHGAVAADDRRCSAAGRDTLQDGGSAVDAAVTVAFCLGVVSPASSGLGGGAFMLVRLSSGKALAFNMRETAPLAASKDMYTSNSASKSKGPLSIAVPGELAGLYKAWKRFGKLSWARLVRPAYNLAENGFQLSPYLHMQLENTKSDVLSDEGLRQVFTTNGTLLKVGEICYNKRLAKTLQEIANLGPSVFYNGSVGAALVADVTKLGGILSMEDLRRYKVKVTRPLSADIVGLKFLTMPPPSAGGAGLILVLNILSQYGFPTGVTGPLGVHRLIESLKHFFAIRPNLGDPDFINNSQVLSDMLSRRFAAKLKKTIFDNTTFDPDYYGYKWNIINEHGTSHLCIVDSEGNAVSMTTTINSYFGSKILSLSTGIVLNNEMDDFSVPSNNTNFTNVPPPAPNNFIQPLKRPMSSMTPSIVLKDGELKAVVGASGGVMIPAATMQVVLNYFALQLDPFTSVYAPRVYHKLIPNVVQYENWTTVIDDHIELPASTREELKKKGHFLNQLTSGGAVSQFIVQNFGELTAVSDPRKGGVPAGF